VDPGCLLGRRGWDSSPSVRVVLFSGRSVLGGSSQFVMGRVVGQKTGPRIGSSVRLEGER
jgi:hypothetical protein